MKQVYPFYSILSKPKEYHKYLSDNFLINIKRELVVKHSVSGIQVHDAKIPAAMKAHNIENLLTLNAKD